MSRFTRATVNVSALRHNLERVRALAPGRKVMAVVKANAYGHGLADVAHALSAADAYAVATVQEARELRGAGVNGRIILLEGIHRADDLSTVSELDLDMVVHDHSQLQFLANEHALTGLKVWLKFDTGMNRLGFHADELPEIYQTLLDCPATAKDINLMSHLACADEPDNEHTRAQIARWQQTMQRYPGEKSLANSAGILVWPQTHADWVRAGLMLYGVSPVAGFVAENHLLQPAMTLSSELIAVHQVRAGETVGYGATYTCPEDMMVGTVAIGYGDGYPRFRRPGANVVIHGRQCPVIGNVSMDMTCVDLRDVPSAQVGAEVELWGQQLPIELVAQWADTIPWVLMCGITRRVEMEYVAEQAVPRPAQVC